LSRRGLRGGRALEPGDSLVTRDVRLGQLTLQALQARTCIGERPIEVRAPSPSGFELAAQRFLVASRCAARVSTAT
jgi:hypothetical protein